MSTVVKLEEKELQNLKKLQNEGNEIQFALGQIEVSKNNLEKNKVSILEKLDKLQQKQTDLAKNLQEKYGEGNIDLEKGEFTKTN
tara:strand:- start:1160 stop:1414 length:255 start_codon:yes stop_codon:yes gene_type:complete